MARCRARTRRMRLKRFDIRCIRIALCASDHPASSLRKPARPRQAFRGQQQIPTRWTVKFVKARPLPGGRPGIDIAIPRLPPYGRCLRPGYKSSIAICRRYGFIRSAKVTDGARFDGRMLRDVVTRDNTASDVWADTAYRSHANEAWLKSMDRGQPHPPQEAQGQADVQAGVRCECQALYRSRPR